MQIIYVLSVATFSLYEDIDLYPYCPYCGAKMDKEREVD